MGAQHTPTFEERAVAAGHTLSLNEEGEVDQFVCDSGTHNGPGCSVCGWSQCRHCDGEIEPCDGGEWKRAYEARERVRDAAPDLLEALAELRRVCADIPAIERNPKFAAANQRALVAIAIAEGAA